MLGTLTRAGAVLDLFTTEEPEWGVTAAAQRLGIGKSLAHDILSSLAAIGLLQRVGHGKYRLGWRMISLASVLLRTSELKAHARPVVRDLATREGRSVSLVAWDRGRIIYIDRRFDPRQVTACGPVAGTAAAVDGSAAAKVLLASRPSDEIQTLWGAGRLHTGHASLDELELDLHRIRTHGWAHGVADQALGRRAVAAPVRDAEGCVAAAISLDLDRVRARDVDRVRARDVDRVRARDVDRVRASDEIDFHVRAVVGAASRISASIRQREPARAATQRKLAQAAN